MKEISLVALQNKILMSHLISQSRRKFDKHFMSQWNLVVASSHFHECLEAACHRLVEWQTEQHRHLCAEHEEFRITGLGPSALSNPMEGNGEHVWQPLGFQSNRSDSGISGCV